MDLLKQFNLLKYPRSPEGGMHLSSDEEYPPSADGNDSEFEMLQNCYIEFGMCKSAKICACRVVNPACALRVQSRERW